MTKRQRLAQERAETLRRLLEQERCIKAAAWKAGISYRTACRYRRERLAA